MDVRINMAHQYNRSRLYKLDEITTDKAKASPLQLTLRRMFFALAGVLILCLSLVNLCIAAPAQFFIGEAYNDQQQLLYTESYTVSDQETLVIYKSRHGEILAAKSIQYQEHKPYRPNVTIFRHTSNSTLSLIDQNGVLKLTQTDDKNNEEVIREDDIHHTFVTDTAFNRYIQDNWNKIKRTGKATVNFTLAQNARIVSVDLKKINHEHCNALGYQCLSLKPSNWFLRLLVQEVIIGYDKHLTLRFFNGPANSIADTSKQRVSIHYKEYASQQAQNIDQHNYDYISQK